MVISNHTIGSGIVKDVLAELAKEGMDGKYLGGGIGLQFYLPEQMHRRTSDIDLESANRNTSGTFHDYMVGVTVPLVERGYSVDFSKERQTYDAAIAREGHQVVVQIPRRSEKKFEEVKPRIQREVSNAEKIIYAGGTLRVINPNDLIARKANRADMFSRQYGLDIPVDIDVLEGVERANLLKDSLDLQKLDPEELPGKVAYIRLLADIVDIKAILENASSSIDRNYIKESALAFRTQDPQSVRNLLDRLLI